MKNHYIQRTLPFTVLLLYLLTAPAKTRAVSQSAHVGGEVKEAIKKLWSQDNATRRKAKREIRRIGLPAVEPLLELLEMIEHRDTVYSQKEDEAPAVEERHSYAKGKGSLTVSDSPSRTQVINRLKQDVIDLLVSLRSEQAVSPLIHLMWTDLEISGIGREMLYPGMRALVSLGPIAVPKLIESIENAGQLASTLSQEYGGGDVESAKALIQERAIIALGRIGDVRALPVLKALLTTTNDDGLIYYIKRAITHIEK